MKMIKKLLAIAVVCLLCAVLLAACGGNQNTEEPEVTKNEHAHVAGADWIVNNVDHWKMCECGEFMEVAPHDSTTEKCSVCGVAAIKTDDGTDLFFYDEQGNWIKCVHYDANGNTTEDKNEYEYFEDGNIKHLKMYKSDKLIYESEFGVDKDGYNYEAKATQYKEDGTKLTIEYDNKGDTLREVCYEADGTVKYDYRTEHEYGDNAKKKSEKTYNGEKLIKEINYIVLFEDSWGGGSYKLEVITYNEDGTKTVEYFTESGEPLTE